MSDPGVAILLILPYCTAVAMRGSFWHKGWTWQLDRRNCALRYLVRANTCGCLSVAYRIYRL